LTEPTLLETPEHQLITSTELIPRKGKCAADLSGNQKTTPSRDAFSGMTGDTQHQV